MTPYALGTRPAIASTPLEALESFPALAASRDRLLHVVGQERVPVEEMVAAVESDVALMIAVLRHANRIAGKSRRGVESVVEAVELLSPEAVHSLASRARTFDFFEPTATWDATLEQFRLHAVATQRVADRLATETGYVNRDRLMVTALLHDIGKLADRHDYGGDHALAGGGLARRWGLPESVATAIERHHDADADGDAAYIRLADMLAHYANGAPMSPTELLDCARAIGLGPAELRAIVYELPYPQKASPRAVDRCPLSARELEVLKRLAEGKVYKQIALELHLSASTVRTHLHNIYGKLGTIDRAQAVLLATARGWLEHTVRPTDRRRDRHVPAFESLSFAGAERSAA